MLSSSILKINKKTIHKKVTEFYQFFTSLNEIIEEPYERLTFNQKLLALTLVYYLQGAKIYLFDEILAGFSQSEIENWISFFAFLCSQNCSTIFTDHHLNSNGFPSWFLKNKKIEII